MVPVRVQNQVIRWASRSAGSRSCRTRRIVDSDGKACPSGRPRASRSAAVRSVACSRIAVRLRHPARTPATDRDSTVGRSRRTPRQSRGSVTFLTTWVRGWRDKAVMAEDGISTRSQDEGMTKHHSSSPRGPRPRLDYTPPPSNQLSPHHPQTLPTPWVPVNDASTRGHRLTVHGFSHCFGNVSA